MCGRLMKFKIKGLKCLQLPFYITFCDELVESDIDGMMVPLVGKDGFYYHRQSKLAWMEYKGVARLYDIETFMSEFDILNHIPLTQSSRDAIKVLIKNKECSDELRERYNYDSHILDLREIGRDMRKRKNRVLKQVKEQQKDKG